RVPSDTPQAIERVICEEEPEKPSTLVRMKELAGDLDNIVLMALRKEPARRYASAAAFSEDIGRHLEGQPVLARKDTPWYRGAKYIQGNRRSVVAAALTATVFLAVMVIGFFLLSSRGERKAIESLAVLPLENLSGGPEQEYFADGITEALSNDLAQI